MATADESKKALRFVQERLKLIKLETAPPELLYNVSPSDEAGHENPGCQA